MSRDTSPIPQPFWRRYKGRGQMTTTLAERVKKRLALLQPPKSMRAVSLEAGLGETFVRDLKREPDQSPRTDNLRALAAVLGCNFRWLAEGEGPETNSETGVPVVGYVGAGAEIIPVDDHAPGAGLEYVDACVGSGSAVAVRVRGESMVPALYPGDVVIYEQQARGDLAHLAGRECVVKLADGRAFIKVLRRTAAGAWYLHSTNAEPLVDVTIEWAAPVKAIIRA